MILILLRKLSLSCPPILFCLSEAAQHHQARPAEFKVNPKSSSGFLIVVLSDGLIIHQCPVCHHNDKLPSLSSTKDDTVAAPWAAVWNVLAVCFRGQAFSVQV